MKNLILTLGSILAITSTSLSALSLMVGDHAPCVVLNNIATNGQESEHCIRTPNREGQYKVLEFFSATCSDCMRNLPIVSALAEKISNTATTRLIGLDRNENLIRNYIQQNKNLLKFEVALDTERAATKAYGVTVTPTTFVLDPMDQVIFVHEGVLSPSDVQEISNLVGE